MPRKKMASNGDIRETPAYGIIEIANYLRLPRFSLMNLLECHVIRVGLKNGSLATGRKERGLRGKEVEGN